MNESTTQIVTAVAAASAAAIATALITHWLTKQSTTKDIASGKTPLPQGATPTTSGDKPIVAEPKPAPAPQNGPTLTVTQVPNLLALSDLGSKMPCPEGYHSVPTGQPNFPYMCIQDT